MLCPKKNETNSILYIALTNSNVLLMMMVMMKLPIFTCTEKLES